MGEAHREVDWVRGVVDKGRGAWESIASGR